jgi:acetyl esterase/lipase
MPDIDAVDPELRTALASFQEFAMNAQSLPMMRAAIAAQTAAADPAAAIARGVRLEELRIPGPPGAPPVRVLVYRPESPSGPLPALLQIHGGGYVLGNADMMDPSNREIAAALHCAVFAVDYRLAPETPYPGALEDCYAALKYMFENAAMLGFNPARIGIGGQSAGGGLAAALALLARDRQEVAPAFQHLVFPMIDDRTGAPGVERHPHAGAFVWTYENNQFGWASLLGCSPGSAGVPAYAAAARATALEGLPPTYICCGALDIFLEENLEYARRLVRAGVPVTFNLYTGAPHSFMMLQPDARISKRSARDTIEALGLAMQPKPGGTSER